MVCYSPTVKRAMEVSRNDIQISARLCHTTSFEKTGKISSKFSYNMYKDGHGNAIATIALFSGPSYNGIIYYCDVVLLLPWHLSLDSP